MAVGYAVLMAAAGLVLWRLADAWPPATALAFGPRWVLAVPLPLLSVLAAWRRSWAAGGWVVVAAGVVAGPVTGGVVSPPAADRGPATLRVMTLNLGGTAARPADVRRLIEAARPDLVAFQELPPDAARLVPDGYTVAVAGSVGAAARGEVAVAGSVGADALGLPGAGGRFAAGGFELVSLHLPTPREGFDAADRWAGTAAVSAARDRASAVARAWAGDPNPAAVVAGDFNTPVESRVYARHWADWGNAFSAGGLGWGWTKHTRRFGVRIDHILVPPGRTCRRAWVGPDVGSDHRPLFADLDPAG